MFSIWTRPIGRLAWFTVFATALVFIGPSDSAQAQNGTQVENTHHCGTWAALRGKCAKANPNTDDILDHPHLYTGRDVTLEGRVDHIYSPTAVAMQDNYDLITSDRILMISVLPSGARAKDTTVTLEVGRQPLPVAEAVELLQRRFEPHKIIRASGTVRMFDRAALEQEFGPINWGATPLEKFQNEPVLLIGAREFAAYMEQHRVEQQAAVIPPEPLPPPPPPPEVERAPQPEAVQPAPAPQPEPEPAAPAPEPARPVTSLPKTASPVPLIGLMGLVAFLLSLGIRAFRT